MRMFYNLVKINKLVSNHRIKFAGLLMADILRLRYMCLRLDPIVACNLRCRMCGFSMSEYRESHKGIFKKVEIDRVAAIFFPKTLQLVIGCSAEPTCYKGAVEIVKMAKSYKIPDVGFVSNGQLLTKEDIEKFISHKLDELTISLHGVQKETYEKFMVGASYERLHNLLGLIDSLKEQHKSHLPSLRLNYTVNADNIEELSQFFDVFGKYNIKTLQIRPMAIWGEYRTLELYEHIDLYNKIVSSIEIKCREKGITFLYVKNLGPVIKSENTNYSSVIVDAVQRYISPMQVWRKDFNWRDESYDEYCKRTHWRKHILDCIFLSKRAIIEQNPFKTDLRYDVID